MELTFAQQSTAFLWSIVLGLFFGLLYSPFKIFRMCFSLGKISLFIVDFIYMICVSLGVFYFSLAYLFGYVRAYTYIGALIGFLAYRMTLGRLASRIYQPAINSAKKIRVKLEQNFKKILKNLLKIIHNILYNETKRRIFKNKSLKKAKHKRVIANNEKS